MHSILLRNNNKAIRLSTESARSYSKTKQDKINSQQKINMKRSINGCLLILAGLFLSISAFSAPKHPVNLAAHTTQQTRRSHLFARQLPKQQRPNRLSRWTQPLRRRCVIGCASLLLAASVFTAQPAHASSPVLVENILEKTSPSLDKIIDRYVKEHMFNDDTYDPIESAYREAYDDAVKGTYPQALREVTGFGSSSQTTQTTGQTKTNPITNFVSKIDIGALLTSLLSFLQTKLRLSESAAIMVLAAIFVVAGPSAFLFTGMIVGGMSKRNISRVMKKRYGDTYTVDATMKQEESVEAPDDDDEDDDEDDSDEDKDDDDDEE